MVTAPGSTGGGAGDRSRGASASGQGPDRVGQMRGVGLPVRAGSFRPDRQCGRPGSDRRPGAATSTLWGQPDDLSEACGRPAHVINHKRVDRLYTEARLQLKRRPTQEDPESRLASRWCAPSVAAASNLVRRTLSSCDRTARWAGHEVPDHPMSTTPPIEAVAPLVPARAPSVRLPVTRVLDRLASHPVSCPRTSACGFSAPGQREGVLRARDAHMGAHAGADPASH